MAAQKGRETRVNHFDKSQPDRSSAENSKSRVDHQTSRSAVTESTNLVTFKLPKLDASVYI